MLIFYILGHFWWENGRGHHARSLWSGGSRPDQKIGPLDGPFDPTTTSKSRFRNFHNTPWIRGVMILHKQFFEHIYVFYSSLGLFMNAFEIRKSCSIACQLARCSTITKILVVTTSIN